MDIVVIYVDYVVIGFEVIMSDLGLLFDLDGCVRCVRFYWN